MINKNIKPGTSKFLRISLFTLIYAATAYASLQLCEKEINVAPVWPATGIALALMLTWGTDVLISVLIGAFTANIIFLSGIEDFSTVSAISLAAIYSLSSTLELIIVYFFIKRLKVTNILAGTRAFKLFFLSIVGACFINATIGATMQLAFQRIDNSEFSSFWLTWYLANLTGFLLFTPTLIAWRNSSFPKFSYIKKLSLGVVFMTLLLATTFIFDMWPIKSESYSKDYFLFLLFILCALYMGHRLTSVAIFIVVAIATFSTLNGQGPFNQFDKVDAIVSLQVFLCVASFIMIFLSTTIKERKQNEMALIQIKNSLEQKVELRTREIKNQEEFLKESNRQLLIKTQELERSNREFQNFAHMASHDMQEPLRTISSYLQILDSRYKDKLDKDGKVIMNYAVDGAKRLQLLIKDLLTYSSVESKGKEFEETDLNVVIDIVCRNLQSKIDETNARIYVDPGVRNLFADTSQLIQLFQNIIDNALKYRSDVTPEIIINAEETQTGWLVSVKDNGIGIENKFLDKIFVIFQRLHTRDKYPGTGIGLTICKKIIERHGGKIWAESQPGNGTTFYFTVETRHKYHPAEKKPLETEGVLIG